MPKVIALSGVVGWDINANDLREEIENANGDDIRFDINSPGGSVFDGIEIYNMIKSYEGKTETRLISLGASMGSVIALAGDKKTANDTAVYMIHNPWSIAIGDYRDFQKETDIIKNLADHMAALYSRETGIKKSEISTMMDDESWFFGEEMAKFGIEIIETEQEKDGETAVAVAKLDFESCLNRMEKDKKQEKTRDIAALFGDISTNPGKIETTSDTSGEKITKEDSIMNLTELLEKNPEAKAEIDGKVNNAVDEGVKADRERVAEIVALFGSSEMAIIAIKEGKDVSALALDEKKKAVEAAKNAPPQDLGKINEEGQLPKSTKKVDPKLSQWDKLYNKEAK